MTGLGNVFDSFEGEQDSPRGPDLRVSVEVPRAALGGSIRVQVPARLAADGDLVERIQAPGEDPDRVLLHLPGSLPAGAVLRLRGQGGGHPDGRPGDLYVVIELVDRPLRPDEWAPSSPSTATDPTIQLAPASATLTWAILLGLALLAAGVLALLFA